MKVKIVEKQTYKSYRKELENKGERVNTITKAEGILAEALHKARISVISQHEVGGRSFDFKVEHYPILIEVDGRIHLTAQKRFLDYRKDRFVQRRGFKVLRFTNTEIIGKDLQRTVNEIRMSMKYCIYQPREIELYPLTLWEQIRMWIKKGEYKWDTQDKVRENQ